MTPDRPHVFVIVADCLRAASATPQTMPFVTRTADLSVDRCYAPSTWTFPSFATLYAQQTPIEHGATRRGQVLDESLANLPRKARENGYYTALFSENPTFSEKYGFHHHVDLVDDSINFKPFFSPFSAENHVTGLDLSDVKTLSTELLKRPDRIRNVLNTAYGALSFLHSDSRTYPHHGDRVFDHITTAVESSPGERLFVIANLLEPHDPHHTPPPIGAEAMGIDVSNAEREALYAARDTKDYLLKADPSVPRGARSHFSSWTEIFAREEDIYRAQIRYFDHLFERWFADIPDAIRRNALVIVTGDHGQLFGEEGMVRHQLSLHPHAIEVPLFVSLPDSWSAQRVDPSGPVSWLGLSKQLERVTADETSDARTFVDGLVAESGDRDGIVVAADGPIWNTAVLNEAAEQYDTESITELKRRRVGVIDGTMQTVYDASWNGNEITEIVYEYDDGGRVEVSRSVADDLHERFESWLSEPAREDRIDARASVRLKQLGYL